jgi:DNA invertase Pin-like site-specific DNA recombinase
MTTRAKQKAIGYVRVSTERQAEEGLGLEAQTRAVQAWAKGHDVRLLRVVRDEGVSGALETRPGLGELLEALAAGMLVVVPRLDRLARDQLTQELLLRDIRQRGADVVSCSAAEADYLRDDPDDPTRKLIRQVLGAVSEFERALIRLRLQRGRALKAEKGGYAFGSPPFGQRASGKALVPNLEEQEAIAHALRLRGEGRSLRDIAAALNDGGHRPRRSDRWHPMTVARVLRRAEEVKPTKRTG